MRTRYTCIDLEMTGLSIKKDRVVEFFAVKVIDDEMTSNKLHHLINPDRSIPIKTTRIHGITDEDIKDKPFFPEVAREIIDFLGNDPIIIYGPKIEGRVADIAFLNKEFELSGFSSVPEKQFINLYPMVNSLYKVRSLDRVLEEYGIDTSKRKKQGGHGAELDAILLAQVYPKVKRDYALLEVNGLGSEVTVEGPMAMVLKELQL